MNRYEAHIKKTMTQRRSVTKKKKKSSPTSYTWTDLFKKYTYEIAVGVASGLGFYIFEVVKLKWKGN
ncbi:hypothetical protein DFA_05269 [Cavenderia fasciculata]|uniref:Uncharacterized protein n=1 Tax=Cavenderia fasciculata TaxID=261658 RepID=F4PNT6_CACFS|nr:uncharacterized protein DFA_05269 [Cavenderia fasciculata]EGG23139.1 hypothetical protein DFA_05269 [Cavenderia fasciculata]|eukprot:XP_004360990.1 hypothetical protein DFA_05269 [Cavenderia fasciculata]